MEYRVSLFMTPLTNGRRKTLDVLGGGSFGDTLGTMRFGTKTMNLASVHVRRALINEWQNLRNPLRNTPTRRGVVEIDHMNLIFLFFFYVV